MRHAPTKFRTYYEPFVGSGCVFLALRPKVAVLGDINSTLIDTYRTVKARWRVIYADLQALPSSKRQYAALRRQDPETLTATQRAVRFLYLNRHCFNGVYRENRLGLFNVPYGSKIPTLHSQGEFQRFASCLREAELRSVDFEKCLFDVRKTDFVYLDPPYAKRGARNRGEYGANAFTRVDVSRLVRCLRDLDARGAHVLVSFFDSTVLRRELSDWSIESITVARSVSGFGAERRSAREIILKNY